MKHEDRHEQQCLPGTQIENLLLVFLDRVAEVRPSGRVTSENLCDCFVRALATNPEEQVRIQRVPQDGFGLPREELIQVRQKFREACLAFCTEIFWIQVASGIPRFSSKLCQQPWRCDLSLVIRSACVERYCQSPPVSI